VKIHARRRLAEEIRLEQHHPAGVELDMLAWLASPRRTRRAPPYGRNARFMLRHMTQALRAMPHRVHPSEHVLKQSYRNLRTYREPVARHIVCTISAITPWVAVVDVQAWQTEIRIIVSLTPNSFARLSGILHPRWGGLDGLLHNGCAPLTATSLPRSARSGESGPPCGVPSNRSTTSEGHR